MFFIGIFGIQDKIRVVKEFSNTVCQCGKLSRGELIEQYTYFHFFFIPVFKWNKRYFVKSRCCNRMFRVPEDYVEELKNSYDVDVTRLEEVNMFTGNQCPNCGAHLDPSFSYCPYCGEQV